MKSARIMVLIYALLFWQCDNDLYTYELPPQPQKLVLNFVGDNSMVWQGTVSATHNVLTQNGEMPDPTPEGVKVLLYEDGVLLEELVTHYCCWSPYYSDVNKPRPGHLYKLDVTSDVFGTATASYAQPSEVVSESFQYRVLGERHRDDGAKFYDMEFDLSFNDTPGPDYYEIFVHVLDAPPYFWDVNAANLESNDPDYSDATDGYGYFSPGFMLDDRLFDGQTAKLRFKTSTIYGDNEHGELSLYAFAVQIRHFTPEYYHYLRAFANQVNNRYDPYAQPVSVPNNIQNGFGIFGGFTKTLTPYFVQ